MKRLLVIGGGGHGRALAEIVLSAKQYELIGFVDDISDLETDAFIWNIPILGSTSALESYRKYADLAIVAIGNNSLRESLYSRLEAAGFSLVTIIHPLAIVSPRAIIGAGCAIMAGAIVGTEARLGKGVIVNSGAVVDHHCQVEDFGHLGVNACMSGSSVLGRGAWMQAATALGYGVHTEKDIVLTTGEVMVTNKMRLAEMNK